MTPGQTSLLHSIELAFKESRLDLSEQASLCTSMIEDALGVMASEPTRAKMEEILVHGVTPEHIAKAAYELQRSIV